MSDQSQDTNAGYQSMSNQEEGMGGATDNSQAGGTGTAGQPGATGEKPDWLDKGITSVGKKLGFNVSQSNADKAGDFANKEAKQYGGRNLPGVQ